MADVIVQVSNLSKKYQLGTIGYGSFRHDMQSWWARMRGREDPNAPVTGEGKSKQHGDFWALRDVNFDITQGERVGIIGKNGAGKSTLLKILSQITWPTEGTIKIRGKVASLLEVGTGFHQELTGRENVFLNGAIMGMKRAEIQKKFDEIVSFAGVEEFIDTPVKRYSSGMYVRLGFSVAAHLDSDILIVDEVLAVGDAAFQRKCLGKMESVSSQGRTVLFVSHNMFAIQNLCSRGILLEKGRTVFDGNVSDVVQFYMGYDKSKSGEIAWESQDTAPGNSLVKLKAVRIRANGRTVGNVNMDHDFDIEIEFWNLEEGARRMVSIDINNSIGVKVLLSANFPSVSLTPDPWFERRYSVGLFRSSCKIPGGLLNDDQYTVSVFINDTPTHSVYHNLDALAFIVEESGTMRNEYVGAWVAAVRPRLGWTSAQLPDE
ncbi:MAG: polysaccharide ABC transporter ATP-binding protein [Spirochaetia bacterium]